jgi:cardiolipin synthase
MVGRLVDGNGVRFLHDGDECFPAMLDAIACAQREVLLEMYWFDSDQTGRRFAEALSERARTGVRVHVIYDAFGSIGADTAMFDGMRAAGCHVFEYHPVAPWRSRFRIGRINNRDHRKMLIVDGCVGFTGGLNLCDLWASQAQGGAGYRDDMVRVEGPVVADMRALFYRTYRGFHGIDDDHPMPAPAPSGSLAVSVLANDGFRERRRIRRVYLAEIVRAKHEIVIVNAYFIPDRHVRSALRQARQRGVRVRVMLPVESDVVVVRYATRKLYSWMLRRGIEIYEWGQSILHSKTAIIDGEWCTVGTHNFDYRSWAYNLEVNLAIRDRGVTQQLMRRVQRDFDASVPVSLNSWRARPLLERVAEEIFYMLRRFL